MKTAEELQEENARLREALEKYADPDMWDEAVFARDMEVYAYDVMGGDPWLIAQEALKDGKTGTEEVS